MSVFRFYLSEHSQVFLLSYLLYLEPLHTNSDHRLWKGRRKSVNCEKTKLNLSTSVLTKSRMSPALPAKFCWLIWNLVQNSKIALKMNSRSVKKATETPWSKEIPFNAESINSKLFHFQSEFVLVSKPGHWFLPIQDLGLDSEDKSSLWIRIIRVTKIKSKCNICEIFPELPALPHYIVPWAGQLVQVPGGSNSIRDSLTLQGV